MIVLVADKFSPRGIATLEEHGLQVMLEPDLTAQELPEALKRTRAHVLIVRSTQVTHAAVESGRDLALIVRAGAGVNTIDCDAASRAGIYVANCPGQNAIAVAELTMGLVLSLDRHIPDAVADLRQGKWDKKRYGQARGLFGRTLGLVGFGAIAREVARRALAFGMRVRTWSLPVDAAAAAAMGVEFVPELDDLLRASDVVTVHVPYSKQTHHLISRHRLASMKAGAVLVHTARGGIVDDAALAEAVAAGRIGAAADVFEQEPAEAQAAFAAALAATPGFYGTPHVGASTEQAESAIADETVRIVLDFLRTGTVHNTVNVLRDRTAHWKVIVRHLDRVGILAGVLEALREEHLNVQDMSNIVFSGGEAAIATIDVEGEPSTALVERLQRNDAILAVEVRAVRP
jgi:D-3-phosphoglycerate dehydrogenase